MIIVWRGWGILVPVFLIIAFVAATAIRNMIGGPTTAVTCLVFTLTDVAAGLAIWFAARALEARPGRVLVDKQTGREVKFGASAGSFFFIPTRYWAFLSVGLGLVVGLAIANHWNIGN